MTINKLTLFFICLTLIACGKLKGKIKENSYQHSSAETGIASVTSCEIPFPPIGGNYRIGDFKEDCSAQALKGTWRLVQLKCNGQLKDLCTDDFISMRINIDSNLVLTKSYLHSSKCQYTNINRGTFDEETKVYNIAQSSDTCSENSICSDYCNNGLSPAIDTICKINKNEAELYLYEAENEFCHNKSAEFVFINLLDPDVYNKQ